MILQIAASGVGGIGSQRSAFQCEKPPRQFMARPMQIHQTKPNPMKTLLALSALTVIALTSGCVTVKREEPVTTRTTTVTPAVPVGTVTTRTTTY
jgi:hypothetical protein